MSKEIVSGKFTPGPWEVHFLEDGGFEIHDRRTQWESIVLCTRYPAAECKEEFAANARLIAAAPDLLAALEHARFAMRAPLDGWKGEVERAALDKAGAAIAKALGEIAA